MRIFKTWNRELDDKQLNQVTAFLESGELMIWPTDTLYAMACDALNPKAVERLCRLKGLNPNKSNLSIVCSDISQASVYAHWDNCFFSMLKRNTPGKFTFIFKTASTLPKVFKGRKKVGVRIPELELNRQIAEKLGRPLLTTSINFDTVDYAVNPELIIEKYSSDIDFMIDAGNGGIEPSTVVDCTGNEAEIIRQGAGELT